MSSSTAVDHHGNSLAVDRFEARPTAKIGKKIEADGDTWQEQLAVCEAPGSTSSDNNKLMIRSYYQNERSGKRVWDEPPSGASHIRHATEDMRRMAQVQLDELHVVTGQDLEDTTGASAEKKKKKRGFFGFGKKKNKYVGYDLDSCTSDRWE